MLPYALLPSDSVSGKQLLEGFQALVLAGTFDGAVVCPAGMNILHYIVMQPALLTERRNTMLKLLDLAVKLSPTVNGQVRCSIRFGASRYTHDLCISASAALAPNKRDSAAAVLLWSEALIVPLETAGSSACLFMNCASIEAALQVAGLLGLHAAAPLHGVPRGPFTRSRRRRAAQARASAAVPAEAWRINVEHDGRQRAAL